MLLALLTASGALGADGFAPSWQLRASQSGSDGDSWTSTDPNVAYNSQDDEYLVVWTGTVGATDEHEVYGRLADRNGKWLGSQFRISHVGTDGDTLRDAANPSVAYDPTNDRYLVVWQGDYQADGADEIYGVLVSAAGATVGSEVRLSDMGGTDSSTLYDASWPDVAYNPVNSEFLVVWMGDDNTGSLVDNEFEIYGQRVTAAGAETGTNDVRLSDMGPDGNSAYTANFPRVAADTTTGKYLVTWTGDDNTAPLVDGEWEAWSQLVNANGTENGTDTRLSDMGPNGSALYTANRADVAYNSVDTEYLVAWEGDDNTAPLVDGENEIFVQKVTAAGAETGTNDIRISDMGTDGSTLYAAQVPSVAFNPVAGQYLVAWQGDDTSSTAIDGQIEIWAQRLDSNAAQVGDNDRRISRANLTTSGTAKGALTVALAASTRAKKWHLAWESDPALGSLNDNEYEIYDSILGIDPGIDMATSGNIALRIDGAAANTNSGFTLRDAGDVNNDGISDVLVGAPASWAGGSGAAASYVVWGGSLPRTVDLNALGTNGFKINAPSGSGVGMGGVAMGDLNADGYDDIALTGYSKAYVVFGKATTTAVDVASLGSGGYVVDGSTLSSSSGWAVDAGDVNGDGKLDLIAAQDQADLNSRTNSGSVFVVFGKSTTTTVNLASLGTDGWRIDGASSGIKAGYNVGAGDVTGDGKADILVGANLADNNFRTDSGSVWVVFGKAGTGNVDLNSLGSAGYRIDGAVSLDELSSATALPDMNGDGIGEVAVGAPWAWVAEHNVSTGAAYVLWGKTSTSTIDLNSLGSQGYRITGVGDNDGTGITVRSAGDIDNDGTADLYVGAEYTDNNSRTDSGSGYIVFGKANTDEVNLDGLGTQGFRIDGAAASDNLGSSESGQGGGVIADQNADGFDEVLAPAMMADPSARTNAGQSYIVSPALMLATVTTDSATSITTTGATLNGTYNGNGQSGYSFFEWGTSTAYGSSTSRTASGTGAGTATASITGLTANTLYHYRLVVEDVDGFRSYGGDQIFSTENTAPGSPSVSGGAANWQNVASQTITATGGDDYQGTGAATGQLARYEFDAGSGSSVADRTGNGYSLLLNPTSTWTTDRFGNPNSAIAFSNGGSADIQGSFTTGGTMSVAMWAKFDNLNGSWSRLFDFGGYGGTGALNVFALSKQGAGSDDLRLVVEDWDSSPTYVDGIYANNVIQVGKWQHYVATIDATGLMKLYVDGVLVASGGSHPLQSGVRDNYFFGTSNFIADDELEGAIDGVVITNNVLSASDAAALAGASGVKRYEYRTSTDGGTTWSSATTGTSLTVTAEGETRVQYRVVDNNNVAGAWTPTTATAASMARIDRTSPGTPGAAGGSTTWSNAASATVTAQPGTDTGPTGLKASYFNNMTLTGSPVLTQTENVDFTWTGSQPDPLVNATGFSARWEGGVTAPTTGTYTFQTQSDDGIRLWVNGQQVINDWSDHPLSTVTSAGVALTAGQTYPVVLEYYQNTGGAQAHLLWQTPGSGSYVAIPKAQLSPLTYEYRQSTDGGTTWSPTPVTGAQATVTEQGETQVQYRATDAAGNVSGWGPASGTAGATVRLDRTGAGGNSGSELVSNGSFESPALGSGFQTGSAGQGYGAWSITSGTVELYATTGGWNAAAGSQSVDMDGSPGPGAISQTITTTPGTVYRISFALSGNPGGTQGVKELQVGWGGSALRTVRFDTTGRSTTAMGWTTVTLEATATSTNTALTFQSLSSGGNNGPAIDNVSVVPQSGPTVSGGSLSWQSVPSVTVTGSAGTDALSGVASYQYRTSTDGGSTWGSATAGSSAVISAEGETLVQFRGVDNAGNTGPWAPSSATAGSTVRIDRTIPTDPTVSGGSLSWQSVPGITFTATGSSGGASGLGSYSYRTSTDNGSTWSSAVTGGTWGANAWTSAVAGGADVPQVGVDSAGNAVAVWRQYNGANYEVYTASRPAGGSWGTPAALTTGAPDPQTVALAVGADGTAVAVWDRYDGSNYRIYAAVRSSSGVWGTPAAISTAGSMALNPKVAIDATGNAVAAWEQGGVQAARYSGGAWGSPQTVGSTGADQPRVAMNATGETALVWRRSDGTNTRTEAATRSGSGAWSAVSVISASGRDAQSPNVAVTPAGAMVATWIRSDGTNTLVQTSERPSGGAWGAGVSRSAAGQNATGPQIASHADGGIVLTWTRYDGTAWRVQAIERTGAGTWGSVSDMSDPAQNGFGPSVATSANGDAILTWYRWDGARYRVQSSVKTSGGSWGATTTHSDTGATAYQVQAAMAPDGTAVLVWQYSGSPSRIQSAVRTADGRATVAAEGTTLVQFRATDGAGNVGNWAPASAVAGNTAKIDRTAPGAPTLTGGSLLWRSVYSASITASAASDPLSGVSGYEYRTSTDAGSTWSSATSGATATASANGETLVQFRATDTAGNVGSWSPSSAGATNTIRIQRNTIVLRGQTSNTNSGGASLVLTVPAGTVANDLLLAQVAVDGGSGTTITAPAGWTLIGRTDVGSTAHAIYQRTATGSETATYTWTFSGSLGASGGMVGYAGVEPSSPTTTTISTSGTGTPFNVTAPTVTVPDSMLVILLAQDSNGTLTAPASMSQLYQSAYAGPRPGVIALDEPQPTTGSPGVKSTTASPGVAFNARSLVLRPLDTTAPTTPTVSGGSLSWQSVASVTVSASGSTDANTGVTSYQYRTSTDGGSTWGSATTGASVAISAEGTTLVQFRAVDGAGNASAWTPSSAGAGNTVKLDRTAPGTPTVSGGSLSWQSVASVTVSASAGTDATSGVSGYEYRTSTDGGTTWAATATSGAAATITEQGETLVQFRTIDNAGNVSAWTPSSAGAGNTVRIDRTGPGGNPGAELVTNGGFETPAAGSFTVRSTSFTGWTIVSGDISLVGSYWQAAAGSQSLELHGTVPGKVSQTLATTAGATYRITFQQAPNPDPSASSLQEMQVEWGGAVLRSVRRTKSGSLAAMGWQTVTLEATATGSSTTLAFAALSSGNMGMAIDAVSVTQQAGPTVSGGSLSWQSVASVAITGASATDAFSGVASYQYRTSTDGGSTWGSATAGSTATISAEGETLVQFRGVDNAGNTGPWAPSTSTAGSTARIDRTAPAAPTVGGGSLSWQSVASVDVKASGGSDTGGSSLSGYEYRTSTDGGTTWGTATSGGTATISAEGETLVQFRTVDGAGNTSAWTPASATAGSTARIDRTAPGTTTVTGGSTSWQSVASVTVTGSGATDSGGSAVSGYQYRTSTDNGSTWGSATSGGSVAVTAEGTTLVQFRAVDGAGNTGAWSPSSATSGSTVKLDRTAPSAPTVSGGSSSWLSQASTTVTASGSTDATAGVSGYEYRTSTDGGSTWSAGTSGAAATITAEGTTLVQFRAVDVAGNASAWTPASATAGSTVKLDRTAPGTPTVSGGSLSWQSVASVTVTASAGTDATSGVSGYEYRTSTDGGTTWAATATSGASAAITEQGETLVQFRTIDNAGNVSAWTPSSAGAGNTVRIDRTGPGGNPGAELVTDGGFETPSIGVSLHSRQTTSFGGWTVSSGNVDLTGAEWIAASGSQSLDLNGDQPGAVTQTLATTAGATYRITFRMSGNMMGGALLTGMRVDWGGSALRTVRFDTTGATSGSPGWTTVTLEATASSSSTALTFTSLTAGVYGPAIDDVSVTQQAGPTVSGGSLSWQSVASVAVTGASATDAHSGVASYQYRTSTDGGSTWGSATAGSTATISAEGETLVQFRGVDNAGNTGPWAPATSTAGSTARIDRTIPVAPTVSGGSLSWQSVASIAITASSSTDTGGSSLSGYQYRTSTDGGTTWGTATSGSTATITAEGETLVQFRSVDGAGNTSAWTPASATAGSTARIDRTAPGAATVSGGSTSWQSVASVTVTGSGATDSGGSALSGYEYRTSTDNGTTWGSATSGTSVAITAEGTTIVQFRALDNAGNAGAWAPVSATSGSTVKLDRTAPTAPTVSGGSTSWLNQASTTVTASASTDAVRGAGYEYRTSTDGGTTWDSGTAGSSAVVSAAGETLVQFRALDVAGNAGVWTPASATAGSTVRLDRTSPTATTAAASGIGTGTATLNGSVNPGGGSATDAWFEWGTSPGSLTNTTAISPAGTGSSAVAQTAAISGLAFNSTYYFRMVAEDAAGNRTNGSTLSVTTDNAFTWIDEWSSAGSGTGQITSAEDVEVGPDGRAYVADSGNDRIQVFDFQGNFIRAFGTSGTGATQLRSPRGIAFNASGDVFVADHDNGRVQVFSSTGTHIRTFGGGTLSAPNGIAIAANGEVFVTDEAIDQVFVFDQTGALQRSFGSSGSGPGQITLGENIAVNGTHVFVTDESLNRISRFTLAGAFVNSWSTVPPIPGMSTPQDIEVDGSGDVYVTNYGTGLIHVYDVTGAARGQFGTPGSGAGQLYSPIGIAVAPNGTVLVTDLGRNRVLRYAPGSLDVTPPTDPTVAGGSLSWQSIANVTVSASGSSDPGGSGVAGYEYRTSTDGGTTWTGATSGASVVVSAEGETLVQFRAVDVEGNVSAWTPSSADATNTVRLDRTAPSDPTVGGGSLSWQSVASIAISASGSTDAGGSGLSGYEYRTSTDGGATWSPTVTSGSSVTVTEQGETVVQYRAVDGAGNTSAWAPASPTAGSTARIDRTAPGGNPGAELVNNGSFETPAVGSTTTYSTSFGGWAVTGSVDQVTTWTTPAGTRALDLNGTATGTVTQTLTTTPGAVYRITFRMAGTPTGTAIKQMRVNWGGSALRTLRFDITGHTAGSMGWQTVSLEAVASGSSTALAFQSLTAGSAGIALDDVSVTEQAGPTVSGGSLSWLNQASTTITGADATDAHSGVSGYEYRTSTDGGSTWGSATAGAAATVTAEGETLVQFRATDNAGNAGPWLPATPDAGSTVRLDRSDPTAPTVSGGSLAWQDTVSITIGASGSTDAGGSALTGYEYRTSTDAGTSWSGATAGSSYVVTAEGETLVQYRSVDGAGNTSAWTPATATAGSTARIDRTDPGVPAVSGGSAAWQSVASVTVSASGATDSGGSAVAGYEYRTSTDGGTTWDTATAGPSAVITAEGETLVQFRAVDNAGNAGAWEPSPATGASTVRIDRTNPTAPTVSGGSLSWQNVASITITGAASTDAGGSALSGYEHRTSTDGGSTWSAATAGGSLTVTAEGETLVQYRSVDGAGNTSAWTPASATAGSTARIDRTDPTAPTVSGGSLSWQNTASIDITASGSTDGGGSALTGYEHRTSTDAGTTWGAPAAGATATITAEGETLMQYRSVDGAGNTSAWTPASATAGSTARIDRTDPTAPTVSGGSLSWQSVASVTVTGSGATDAVSSVTGYEHRTSTDGGSTWGSAAAGASAAVTAEGETLVQVRSVDAAGNRSAWIPAAPAAGGTVRIDRSAPTAPTVSGGSLGWQSVPSLDISAEGTPGAVTTGGLRGEYFANVGLTGYPVMTRTEAVDFDWGTGSPGGGVPINFSARWTGSVVAPATGTYRFQTSSDDGVRLWVGGAKIIDNWTTHGVTTDTSGTVTLVAGQAVDLTLEFYDNGGPAVMSLLWEEPGAPGTFAAIPASVLSAQPGTSFEYRTSTDGGSTWGSATAGPTATITAEGETVTQFRTVDAAGNTSAWAPVAPTAGSTARIDRTDPTAPTVSGGSLTWQSVASVTVTGSGATDAGGSALSGYQYRWSTDAGGTWTGPVGGSSIAVNAEGETLVQFRSVDNAGNTSAWTPASSTAGSTVRIDRSAPTDPTVSGGSLSWQSVASVTVSASGSTDTFTAVAGYEHRTSTDGGATWGTAAAGSSVTVSAEGETLVQFRVTDTPGNTGPWTPASPTAGSTVRINRSGPSAPTASGGSLSWQNVASVTVNGSGATVLGGTITGYEHRESTDGGTTWTAAASGSSVTVSAEGETLVQFRAIDDAANTGPWGPSSPTAGSTVRIDRTDPGAPTASGGSASWQSVPSITLSAVGATDTPGGVASHEYRVSTDEAPPGPPPRRAPCRSSPTRARPSSSSARSTPPGTPARGARRASRASTAPPPPTPR
ncbi:MAG: choice-of-anchor C family protein [Thermoleophilia bacterium]